MPRLVPVILSGGSGTRLWPMSRRLLPKQFLPLVTERSLLQDTALRAAGIPGAGAPVLVVNQEHRFLAADQLAEAGVRAGAVLLEPVGRHTAPAIAAAAHWVSRADPDALLLVLPSDHAIADLAAFHAAVGRARAAAERGRLVTFGIRPDAPATGYGYIQAGAPLAGCPGAQAIARFVEKPDAATAQGFLAQGGHYWNSGMFLFGARRFLDELERLRPDIHAAAARATGAAAADLDFVRLDAEAFGACPAESVDVAVMERTAEGALVPSELGWSDVGSWAALWALAAKDPQGNAAQGDVALEGARDCFVRADARHVSLLGVDNLLVVETDDAVLVAARERAQEVKQVVERLAARDGHQLHLAHSRVHRPWGYYEGLDGAPGFQVKRLMVKPGHAISLQRHRHRAEHWVVVAGRARVTCEEEVLVLGPNESTYIPAGARHRLENAGEAPLFVVEVQSGAYLGEDDIERFEDRYNRT